MPHHPREACVNCHFFVRLVGLPTRPVLDVKPKEREAATTNDFSWADHVSALKCHMMVWDEGFSTDRNKRFETVVSTDRQDVCFFWPYHPEMLMPAAEMLQKRQAEAREAARDRRLTIWGLWIAAIALVVTAIVGLLQVAVSLMRPGSP